MVKEKSSFFYFISIYALIIPVFEKYIGSIGNVLINGVIVILLMPYILVNRNKIFSEVIKNKNILVLLFFTLVYFVLISYSLIIGSFNFDSNILLRDFYELHKPILYSTLILFTYYYLLTCKNFNHNKYIQIIFLLLITFSFLQFNFSKELSLLYTSNNVYNIGRLTIPFGNPYDYAIVILFFFIFFFFKYFFNSYKYLIPCGLCVYLLFLTGSRAVFLAFLFVIFFILPIVVLIIDAKNIKKIFFFLKIFLSFFIFFILLKTEIFIEQVENNYILEQFYDFVNDNNIGGSGKVRVEQINLVIQRSLDNPIMMIFGNGPSKGLELGVYSQGSLFYSEHLESSFTYLYYRYGLLGLFLFFTMFLFVVNFLIRSFKNLKKGDCKTLVLAILIWILSIPISTVGGMYIEQPRVSFFFYVILTLGFVLGEKKLQKKNIYAKN